MDCKLENKEPEQRKITAIFDLDLQDGTEPSASKERYPQKSGQKNRIGKQVDLES
jgi:hypothetical protein